MKFWPGLILIIVAAFAIVAGLVLTIGYFIEDDPTTTLPLLDITIGGIQVVITGVALIGLAVFLFACVVGYPWPWRRKCKCDTCDKTTRNEKKDGVAICDDCQEKKDNEEALAKSDLVPALCSADGTMMERKFLRGIIVNTCPACKGSWLYEKQVTELKENMSNSRESSRIAGMSMGFFIGMMLGMQLGRH